MITGFGYERRRLICKRRRAVMDDFEPSGTYGEFYHKDTYYDGVKTKCKNDLKTFDLRDLEIGGKNYGEVELFVRKRVRRNAKRLKRKLVD